MGGKWRLFVLGWAVILAGAVLAHAVQTTGGVKVTDVRFPGDKGVVMSGLLYLPPGATAAHPAPAVLISHGYINTREMQSSFAIELSRRGFVVLAMDMTGHGYSGGAVGEQGFGGPAALRYLQSRPEVDRGQIGLEGHSLGGGPVLSAAAAQPDGYRAIVLEGTTPGLLGSPATATPTTPRNVALVFGQFDEFAPLMWQVPKGSLVATSPRLQALFGAQGPVVEGKLYGDVAAGTGRRLWNPPVTHPWEHFSRAGVGHAVDWFQTTLKGEARPLDPNNQIWLWKEIGTLVAFAGFVILLLGTFELLLAAPIFAGLAAEAQPTTLKRDGKWALSLLATIAIPALSFFAFMKLGNLFFPMKAFPQWITNQLLVWAILNGLITLALGLVLRRGKSNLAKLGGPAVLLALAVMAVGYGSLALVDGLFKVDYRFWVLGLKPLDAVHARYALTYLPLWTAYFLVAIRALNANLSVKGEGALAAYATAALAMAGGFAVLVGAQYATLFSTGLLLTPTEPLNVIIAIQFVPLLAVVGIIAAFAYRRTNSYVPGALICAMLICWYVTSGTATHWSPDFKLPIPTAGK
ncbi:alpha/beta hydrolase [Phenylobacterium aquaticum]|uniref:alpha/beta hydrolase n=1 Tax=Phenylobacterium aquaticum TaxID=1763816 RepID=UPI0026EDE929|nr:alpha/beta fold hydrolase [Phenylobacterium aquaticum]